MNTAALPAVNVQPPGMWTAVGKLLRLRFVIFWMGLRRAKLRQKIGWSFITLLGLGFLGFITFLSWMFLRFLRSPEFAAFLGDTRPFLEAVPSIVFSAAFFGILLTSFGVLLQALYLAGDMDFLLSVPLPLRAVFLTKLLQAVLPNFSLIALFAVPVLWGLGASGGYSLLYYPMVLVMLVALALAAAGISSLLVMFIVRVFPARRVAEVLGFLTAIISILCSQSGQIANSNAFGNLGGEQAAQTFLLLERLDVAWSPLSWAGRGLIGIGVSDFLTGVGLSLLALAVFSILFALSLVTAERLYYTGWAGMQAVQVRRRKTRKTSSDIGRMRSAWVRFLEGMLPQPVRAMIVKDYFVLRRDLRNLSHVITPLIFGIVYMVMFLRGGDESFAGRGEAPEWFTLAASNVYLYANVGLSLFVGWMLQARLAGMAFSQEGRSFWLLKSAPVTPRQMILAKFLVAFVPTVLLSWLFVLAITFFQRGTVGAVLYSFVVVAMAVSGNTGINLSLGIVGANLDWDDPRKMVRQGIGCLASFLSFLYLPLVFALFFGPPILAAVLGLSPLVGQVAGFLVGSVLSLVFAFVPLLLVEERLKKLGEA